MSYYNEKESANRIKAVKEIIKRGNLDAALIYYDELNIANGWYLTGWCPQFEKGAVLLPAEGDALLLGGPESEPFAKMSSAIKKTRNFTPFMVPDEEYPNAAIIDFKDLYDELQGENIPLKRIGLVGTNSLPYDVYTKFRDGFADVELIDMTDEYETLRAHKSVWEQENVKAAFALAYEAYETMKSIVKPGAFEHEIAAEGEYICRKKGANSFAYATIVGSGERSDAVVPTAINKEMKEGEWVMLGIAPRVNGYAGTFGDTIPVSGEYTEDQKKAINILRKTLRATKAMLKPGVSGKEIDVPGRKIFEDEGLIRYLVCPFAHTIGLMEAEGPFFGPESEDKLEPGMTVCVDVSFFGHPALHGARVETGYIITEDGCEPLCPEMDELFSDDL
jgi:Xaa-Pro aminopeptidase